MSALGRSLFVFQRRSIKELLEWIAQTESRRWPLLLRPPLWPRWTRGGLHLISVVEFIWHRMKLCNPFLIQSVSVIAWNLSLGFSGFPSSRWRRSIPIWSDKLWNGLTQRPVTINQISCHMPLWHVNAYADLWWQVEIDLFPESESLLLLLSDSVRARARWSGNPLWTLTLQRVSGIWDW